jgi:predicted nucleic acid-binding protein
MSAYDATYLELVLRKSSSLATLDDHLRSAAQEAGVEIFGA